jgi:hypothetical protein
MLHSIPNFRAVINFQNIWLSLIKLEVDWAGQNYSPLKSRLNSFFSEVTTRLNSASIASQIF